MTLFNPRRTTLLLLAIAYSILLPMAVGGHELLAQLTAIAPSAIAMLAVLLLARWLINALRCHLLFRFHGIQFRYLDVLAMSLAYEFATESTPGGVGGPVAGYALLRHHKVPVATIAGIALFILALDIIAIACLLAWAALRATGGADADLHLQALHAALTLPVVLTIVWILVHHRRRLIRYLGRQGWLQCLHVRRRRAASKAWLRIGAALEGMRSIPGPRLTAIMLASIAHWACRLSVIYMIILALDFPAVWADSLLIQFLAGMSGMASIFPGGYGSADLTMSALLAPHLGTTSLATVVLLWRLTTFHATLLLGGLAFAVISWRLRPSRREATTSPVTPRLP